MVFFLPMFNSVIKVLFAKIPEGILYLKKKNVLHIKWARKMKKIKYIFIFNHLLISHRPICPNEHMQFTYLLSTFRKNS